MPAARPHRIFASLSDMAMPILYDSVLRVFPTGNRCVFYSEPVSHPILRKLLSRHRAAGYTTCRPQPGSAKWRELATYASYMMDTAATDRAQALHKVRLSISSRGA